MTFSGDQPTLREAKGAKHYLDEKELRAMGQLVSGYLDFAERQAERKVPMTMEDWAKHFDGILTSTGENLLTGNGSVSHLQAMEKAQTEYRKYKAKALSSVEQDYLDSIKLLEKKGKKK
ncbi:Virulence protein RhuM family protein [Eubacterium barkeri]|uniref:Virulence protein RhuM family protein n=1 Tax=Eubacterium barkeri TaxID=1528 RepID=A0A1H3EQZ0_EUBBA|nr:Virulence protein RhuM family protein [Eubacterium barkeri]